VEPARPPLNPPPKSEKTDLRLINFLIFFVIISGRGDEPVYSL